MRLPLRTISALYVEPRGVYAGVAGVDLWDEARDARSYAGPHPVVAHPPCQRWGRYSEGGPSHHGEFKTGDDGGCFAAALAAVNKWGGVLEHPKDSKAWAAHGIKAPPRSGSWVQTGKTGWTCMVEQGHYGHRARKPTWLYYSSPTDQLPPALIWGPSVSSLPPQTDESLARRGRGSYSTHNAIERMCKRERLATPTPFRDLLISIARGA